MWIANQNIKLIARCAVAIISQTGKLKPAGLGKDLKRVRAGSGNHHEQEDQRSQRQPDFSFAQHKNYPVAEQEMT